MGNRGTEDHKLWLFDLAHGNLTEDAIIKGFIRFYILAGRTLGNVQDDILFHTMYGTEGCKKAMEDLKGALEAYVSKTEEDSR